MAAWEPYSILADPNSAPGLTVRPLVREALLPLTEPAVVEAIAGYPHCAIEDARCGALGDSGVAVLTGTVRVVPSPVYPAPLRIYGLSVWHEIRGLVAVDTWSPPYTLRQQGLSLLIPLHVLVYRWEQD